MEACPTPAAPVALSGPEDGRVVPLLQPVPPCCCPSRVGTQNNCSSVEAFRISIPLLRVLVTGDFIRTLRQQPGPGRLCYLLVYHV